MNILRDICSTLSGVLEYPQYPPHGLSVRINRLLAHFAYPALKPRFEGPLLELARVMQARQMSELQRDMKIFLPCAQGARLPCLG